MSIKRYVWVTFQREGVHSFPAAATEPKLKDVAFLANPHRHIFHFKVMIEVFHDDREIEFILFKRELESLFVAGVQLNNKSCEMLGEEIVNFLYKKYPGRNITVHVSEDEENGCFLIATKEPFVPSWDPDVEFK